MSIFYRRVFNVPFDLPNVKGAAIARMMLFTSQSFSAVTINGWSFACSSDDGGHQRFLGAGVRRAW